jgi:Flp pilus assembly protein TadG
VPRERGSSTVEFTLVSVLVLFLFLLVMQLGFVLHTRNVLVAAAQEGARYGANADRGTADAEARTLEVVSDAMSSRIAARLDRPRADVVTVDGAAVMQVTLSGPLPLVFLPAGPLRITVQGHALEEG